MEAPVETPMPPAALEEYAANGYVVLPSLIGEQDLAKYEARFEAFVNGAAPLPGGMKLMKDVMVLRGVVQPLTPAHAINKLFCLENDPALFSYASHPALVAALKSLLGADIYSLTSNLFNKPPGIDGRHPLHQDLRYFKISPPDKIVAAWTAINPATRENGCLAVIPGSHRQGLQAHGDPDWEYVNHGFYGIEDIDLEKRQHVELAPGDTLLFHPLLIHGSGRNRSDSFRRSISAHFASGDCVGENDWKKAPFTRKVAA